MPELTEQHVAAPPRWQPVCLVLEGSKRLECSCGALAIFVTGKHSPSGHRYNLLEDVDAWCQRCFEIGLQARMRESA